MHGSIGKMQVMDTSGHLEIKWSRDNEEEVESARDIFDEKTDAGYSAFKIEGTQRGERITEFDPKAEKIMLVPQLRGG
jgi:hypothetical protein